MRYDYLTRFAPLYNGGSQDPARRAARSSRTRCTATATRRRGRATPCCCPAAAAGTRASWPTSGSTLLKQRVNVVEDPAVANIGGPRAAYGASPANFIGFTVGDVLKKRTPASRVVGVSLKDRSAILMAGRARMPPTGSTTRSGRVHHAAPITRRRRPPGSTQWNATRLADSPRWRTWSRLLPDERALPEVRRARRREGGMGQRGHRLPAPCRAKRRRRARFYDDLRRTPYGDELRARRRPGGDGRPPARRGRRHRPLRRRVLVHRRHRTHLRPDSQEQMDEYLRLDFTLGRLLDGGRPARRASIASSSA